MLDLGFRTAQLYASFRLRISYTLPDGSTRTASGTGAFVQRSDGANLLVTCRHLVDPRYSTRIGWTLDEVTAEGYHYADDLASEQRQVFSFVDPPVFSSDPDVDLAILDGRRIKRHVGPVTLGMGINEGELCDEAGFTTDISAGDFLVIPGYIDLPDTINDRPVLLAGIIASDPRVPVEVRKHSRTSKVLLYQSLSRAGMSGAPVIATQRGLYLGEGLSGPPHRPVRVVGINTGHFHDSTGLPLQFSHFVPSTHVLRLLNEYD